MFKVGDKVKVIHVIPDNRYKIFSVGNIYEVYGFEGRPDSEAWNCVKEGDIEVIVNHYTIKPCFELLNKGANMSKVNYHLLTDSVVINHNAKTTVVRRGDARFAPIVECIKNNTLELIPELVDVTANFAKQGITLVDGAVLLDGDILPDSLGQRLIGLMEAQMPVDILTKFWRNLKANPSFNSRKMLYKFLEHNGHPLTEDGCFIAYRGVTDDFKDLHTKTFNNAVGQVVEVSRSEVDDNPNNTCSNGLHVACHDYAKGFGPKLIEVKVNPKDVVTVPVDYNGTKMRVCKFEVMAECENIRMEPVYQSFEDQAMAEEGEYEDESELDALEDSDDGSDQWN